IANEIDAYGASLSKTIRAGDLTAGIDSTSVATFVRETTSKYEINLDHTPGGEDIPAIGIDELRAFGISSLNQLAIVINDKFLTEYRRSPRFGTYLGFVREAMIYADVDKYFGEAWQHHFQSLGDIMWDFLVRSHGLAKAREVDALFETKSESGG